MVRMRSKTPRIIRALVARDLADAARNPTVLMSCAAGVLLTTLIGGISANAQRLSPGEGYVLVLVAALCIAPAFAGCVVELYVMAEERERGAYLTLAEAGVTAGEIAVAKWLAATLATLLTQAAACVLLGLAPAGVLGVLAFSLVATQPLLLAGLACGLSAREQMASSLLAVPLTLVAVAPILAFMSEVIRAATWFWPLGSATELLREAADLTPVVPTPALIALMVVWIVVTAAFALLACRRLARDLAAERNRLP